jgi:phenylpropionate dioxygenase-like ring-hydroxylating dioxygenase large terminal subunit
MSQTSISPKAAEKIPYGGYYRREDLEVGAAERELTHAGPGTPMGEYMRRFWQPFCLSEELTDVPKVVRILHERLVAFRDRSGQIGLLQPHCSHRGTSLEFGIVQQRGIRCCYHGWLYDVDGRILETPCEPKESRIKDTLFHGAYPAFERNGVVFGYFGPPEARPDFPEYDAYTMPAGTRLVPFSNLYECNWLQVYENLIDHFHSAVLHNNMTVDGLDAALAAGLNLGDGFREMPVIEWHVTRDGNGMLFTAGRRVGPDRIWVRTTEMALPNYVATASLVPTAAELRHTTVAMSRWQVPVDDENMIVLGWRHFNDEIDPQHYGCEEDCGIDKIDFLEGQTRHRTYEEKQRAPGDYEAMTSQRPVALHHLEHPGRSDVGVYLCRKLLRDAVHGKTPADSTRSLAAATGEALPMYTSDTVVQVATREGEDDRQVIAKTARGVLSILQETDQVARDDRRAHVLRRLDEFDGGLVAAHG